MADQPADEIPIPAKPLSGGSTGDMPSWADFLKMMEAEESAAPKAAEAAPPKRSFGAKKATPATAAPLDPDAEEKRKKRLEEEARRKAELRAKMAAGRSASAAPSPAPVPAAEPEPSPSNDAITIEEDPKPTTIVAVAEPIVSVAPAVGAVSETVPESISTPPSQGEEKSDSSASSSVASETEEPVPLPSKPLSGGAPGMSWADFMKSIENDPVPTDATQSSPARPAGKRAPAAAKKPVDPEEEEKRKQRAAEAERKRQEMKEAITKKKAEAAASKPAAPAAPADDVPRPDHDDSPIRQPTPVPSSFPTETVLAAVAPTISTSQATQSTPPAAAESAPAQPVAPSESVPASEPAVSDIAVSFTAVAPATPALVEQVVSERATPSFTSESVPPTVSVESEGVPPPTPALSTPTEPIAAPITNASALPTTDQQRRAEEALARHQKAMQQRDAMAVASVSAPTPEASQREAQLQAREELIRRQEVEMKRKADDLMRQQEALAATAPSRLSPQSTMTPTALRSSITFEQNQSSSHSDFDFAGLGAAPRTSYREEDLDRIRSEIVSLFRGVLTKHEQALIGFIDSQNQSKLGTLQRENEDLKRKNAQLEAQLKDVQEKYVSLQTASASSIKELAVVRAKVHVSESRVATLENQLQLKVAENLKLTQLCDELISSLESTAGGAPLH